MRRVLGVVSAVVAVAAMAYAPAMTFDYTNTFSGVQTELTTALQALVPLVVVVFAIILAIKLGFSLFRRVTGR